MIRKFNSILSILAFFSLSHDVSAMNFKKNAFANASCDLFYQMVPYKSLLHASDKGFEEVGYNLTFQSTQPADKLIEQLVIDTYKEIKAKQDDIEKNKVDVSELDIREMTPNMKKFKQGVFVTNYLIFVDSAYLKKQDPKFKKFLISKAMYEYIECLYGIRTVVPSAANAITTMYIGPKVYAYLKGNFVPLITKMMNRKASVSTMPVANGQSTGGNSIFSLQGAGSFATNAFFGIAIGMICAKVTGMFTNKAVDMYDSYQMKKFYEKFSNMAPEELNKMYLDVCQKFVHATPSEKQRILKEMHFFANALKQVGFKQKHQSKSTVEEISYTVEDIKKFNDIFSAYQNGVKAIRSKTFSVSTHITPINTIYAHSSGEKKEVANQAMNNLTFGLMALSQKK